MENENTRREYLQTAVVGGAALGLAEVAQAAQTPRTGLPTRVLGRTRANVSILCLGGWHIGAVKDPQEAIRIMHTAIDEGIPFSNNAGTYQGGGREEIRGRPPPPPGRRKRVFLMT